MNGNKPAGTTKVGLLDQYQVWCYLADPFSRHFPYPLYIENEALVEQAMVDYFLPLPALTDTPENTAEIERITALRREVMDDYLSFKTQMRDWQGLFQKPRPTAKSLEEKKALQKEIFFNHIGEWLRETGRHDGRLCFFEAYATASKFYMHVAKRLLSMRTTGSISVERAAKPMKNNVMIKTRNKLQKEKGLVLLSAGLNIRILKTAKKEIIEAAADFYPDSDEESDYEGADEADE